LEKSKQECFIIGVSGGIDSALTSTLCALTGKRTIVVSLPINQKENQIFRAKNHINWLQDKFKNVESLEIDLSETFEKFISVFDNSNLLTEANSKSRLRMVALYHVSGVNKGIVVGTGNKVEDFGVGFFTKYGDGGVDISPIANLLKSEVKNMAKKLGIIEDIINASPTDGLWDDDRTDEQQIGATYEELEWAMETNIEEEKMNDREREVYSIYKKLNSTNQHKMKPIPVFV
jgi:NAD+ synthase